MGSAHTRLAIGLVPFGHSVCAWRKGGRWGSSPQTLARGISSLWTLIRGNQALSEARRTEGAPGLQGSRRATGAPRREVCEAPPIRHGTAVTPSPPGKVFWLCVLE